MRYHCRRGGSVGKPVNCVGVMGRGIALQFKKAFPENFKLTLPLASDEVQPGRMFVFEPVTVSELHYQLSNQTPLAGKESNRGHRRRSCCLGLRDQGSQYPLNRDPSKARQRHWSEVRHARINAAEFDDLKVVVSSRAAGRQTNGACKGSTQDDSRTSCPSA